MSFCMRSCRSVLAGLSVAVPVVTVSKERRFAKPHTNGWVQCSDVPIAGKSSVLIKDFGRGDKKSLDIEYQIEGMWTDLVNGHVRQHGGAPISREAAMRFSMPLDTMQGLEENNRALQWLRPVAKWMQPSMLKRLDFDGDGKMDFKEFAVLLMVAMVEGGQAIPKKSFTKIMYYLMDVDGDGSVSREEFSHICARLAELGFVNAKKIEKVCEDRFGQEDKKRGDLRAMFDKVFLMYDDDASGDIGEAEWYMFAGEWVEWKEQSCGEPVVPMAGKSSVLFKDFGRGDTKSLDIECRIEHMWTELVNWHMQKQGITELSCEKALSYAMPIDAMGGLEDDHSKLKWLKPVARWMQPAMLKRLDFDGDNNMDFKEFAVVLLAAMVEDAQHVTKKSFTKIMYYLMDVDGDGSVSREEFSHVCARLAELGLINVKNIEEMCDERLGQEHKKSGDLCKLFDDVFLLYDDDASGDIGEAEWYMFAGEWLDLKVE